MIIIQRELINNQIEFSVLRNNHVEKYIFGFFNNCFLYGDYSLLVINHPIDLLNIYHIV